MMKHTDLKPGDLVLTGYKLNLTVETVDKVTPRTVVTKIGAKVNPYKSRHTRDTGDLLYVHDRAILSQIHEIGKESRALLKKQDALRHQLERIRFPEAGE